MSTPVNALIHGHTHTYKPHPVCLHTRTCIHTGCVDRYFRRYGEGQGGLDKLRGIKGVQGARGTSCAHLPYLLICLSTLKTHKLHTPQAKVLNRNKLRRQFDLTTVSAPFGAKLLQLDTAKFAVAHTHAHKHKHTRMHTQTHTHNPTSTKTYYDTRTAHAHIVVRV